MDSITIISLNTRGTHNKYRQIIKNIENKDIVLLQEQHISDKHDTLNRFMKDTGRKIFSTTDTTNNKSIMTLIKPCLKEYIEKSEVLIEGRLLNTLLHIKNKKYNIVNVYAPADQTKRLEFFKAMFKKLEGKNNLILGGDFNTITDKNETNGEYKE